MKYKMDHFYGTPAGASTNEIETIKNQLTSLSNIAAKTNIANTFTTHQSIQGYIKESAGLYKDGQSQPVATMKHQSAKDMFFNFIQDTSGFRNYCSIHFRHKYGNQTDAQYTTLLKIETRNTNMGIFMYCENNKFSFGNKTVVSNVVIEDLKTIVAASTDFADFKRRIAAW